MSAIAKAPPSVGVLGTTLAHGLLVAALLLAAHRNSEPMTVSYAVTLTAAPAPTDAANKVVQAAPPQSQPEKTVATKPTAKPKKAPKKPEPKRPTPAEARAAARNAQPKTAVPMPGETPSTGQDVLTRTFPGLNFPYPEYLSRIVNEIYSRFAEQSWPPGLAATVGFTIHRDGSVTDIVMLKQSGSYSFNTATRSAVVAAAGANVFGPLPSAWPDDKLEIAFSFSPRKP